MEFITVTICGTGSACCHLLCLQWSINICMSWFNCWVCFQFVCINTTTPPQLSIKTNLWYSKLYKNRYEWKLNHCSSSAQMQWDKHTSNKAWRQELSFEKSSMGASVKHIHWYWLHIIKRWDTMNMSCCTMSAVKLETLSLMRTEKEITSERLRWLSHRRYETVINLVHMHPQLSLLILQ